MDNLSVREDLPTPICSTVISISTRSTSSGRNFPLLIPPDQQTPIAHGKNCVLDLSKSPQNDIQPDVDDESLRKMRRVDWRWAAAKGFLDKKTNQWNEALGGLEGYIQQRTARVLARYVSATNEICSNTFLELRAHLQEEKNAHEQQIITRLQGKPLI